LVIVKRISHIRFGNPRHRCGGFFLRAANPSSPLLPKTVALNALDSDKVSYDTVRNR
jgi:hypothetical protein